MMMMMMLAFISFSYFVPGTVLSSWHILIHLNHLATLEEFLLISPFSHEDII